MVFNSLKEENPLKTTNSQDCILRPFEQEKVYIKCPHCGGLAEVDTSMVLTSYPPQYNFYCGECKHHGYVFCHELSERQVKKIPEKVAALDNLSTSCLVCGESVPAKTLYQFEVVVCEKCKKAILKVRKMLEDNE